MGCCTNFQVSLRADGPWATLATYGWLGPAIAIGCCVCNGPGVLASASVVCSLNESIALRDCSALLPPLLLLVRAERPKTERLSRLRELDRSRAFAGGGGGKDGCPEGDDVWPDGLWLSMPIRGEEVLCGVANAPLERDGELPMAADMLCCPGFGEYGGGGEGMFAVRETLVTFLGDNHCMKGASGIICATPKGLKMNRKYKIAKK